MPNKINYTVLDENDGHNLLRDSMTYILSSNTFDEDDYERRQIAVIEWLEKYSSKIDYKIGKELEEILKK